MPKIRGNPSEKWVRRASAATPDYQTGVQNPRTDWSGAAAAAAPIQAQAITAAIARGAYSKGIAKAGSAKWQEKSLKKGAPRFAGGVQEGQNDYAQNVQPFLDTISAVALPPRGPAGDPRNLARVSAITTALRNRKVGSGT